MNSASRHPLWLAPPLLWAGFIFWLSTLHAGTEPPPWFLSNDKVVHGVLFGILALFVYFGLRRGLGWRVRRAALGALLAASLYGLSDEWHQRFVPSRNSDPKDWIADTVGAMLFLLPAVAYHARQTRHEAVP